MILYPIWWQIFSWMQNQLNGKQADRRSNSVPARGKPFSHFLCLIILQEQFKNIDLCIYKYIYFMLFEVSACPYWFIHSQWQLHIIFCSLKYKPYKLIYNLITAIFSNNKSYYLLTSFATPTIRLCACVCGCVLEISKVSDMS